MPGRSKSLKPEASGTAGPSSVDFRKIHSPGVEARPGRYKFTYRNRRKTWKQAPSLRFFRARNCRGLSWISATYDPASARQTFEYVREDVMDDDFETPDISDFLASCAKQFCPWCGKPMGRNPMGRLRMSSPSSLINALA